MVVERKTKLLTRKVFNNDKFSVVNLLTRMDEIPQNI